LQECFASLGHQEGNYPHSELAAGQTVALPIYPELSDEQLSHVLQATASYAQSQVRQQQAA
jgi:dTDP-4-amino-4,6-dideoxygalactose transaminase